MRSSGFRSRSPNRRQRAGVAKTLILDDEKLPSASPFPWEEGDATPARDRGIAPRRSPTRAFRPSYPRWGPAGTPSPRHRAQLGHERLAASNSSGARAASGHRNGASHGRVSLSAWPTAEYAHRHVRTLGPRASSRPLAPSASQYGGSEGRSPRHAPLAPDRSPPQMCRGKTQ